MLMSHLHATLRTLLTSNKTIEEVVTTASSTISLFLCLPLATLDTFSLQKEIDTLGSGRASAMGFHTLNTITTWRHDA